MDLKKLLKESTKDMLSDENYEKIQKVFDESVNEKAESLVDEKASLKVEASLAKMDEDHSKKLGKLMEDIDVDHTKKIKRVVEALEDKHSNMLKQIVEKYQNGVKTEMTTFKEKMLTKLDKFFDLVVEESVPQEKIDKAVENTHYKKLFEQISKLLSISEVTQNDLVKEGILDAKKQIKELQEEKEKIIKENKKLLIEKQRTEVKELLSEKCEGLPNVKKEYIHKVLSNKSKDFINENFDYTLKLFDENEDENLENLKKESNTKVIKEKIDRTESVDDETKNDDPIMESYLEGLGKDTM